MVISLTIDDPVETVKTILSTYWDSSNTNSLTPNFDEMREFVVKGDVKYQILIYRRPRTLTEIGRGTHFDLDDLVTVELRVWAIQGNAASAETRFKQMLTEVYRVIGSRRTSPGNNYDYIAWVSDNDQSYRGNNFFRILIDYELRRYGASKT